MTIFENIIGGQNMDILTVTNIAAFFFWVFLILTLLSFLGFLLYLYSGFKDKRNYNYDIELLIYSLGGLLVFAAIAYFVSGPAGYKKTIKQKIHHTTHFYSQDVKLEKKVKELADLRTRLIAKKSEVKRLQVEYKSNIKDLTKEIKAEKRSAGIRSYEQAQNHPRILYDLSLISRKRAYIEKLKEVEKRLNHGTYELEYLERQAIDDLKIVQTLGDDEVEDLIEDINKVIAKYLPESDKLAIEVDPDSMKTPKQIWQEIN
jgi:hypothetical protein